MTRSALHLFTATLTLAFSHLASAAEVKVYSTIGVKSALEELVPQFEKATGNKAAVSWGLISSFTKKLRTVTCPTCSSFPVRASTT